MHLKIQDIILEFCTYVWPMNRETVNSTADENFIIFKLSYDKSKLLTIFFKICSPHSCACLWNYRNLFRLQSLSILANTFPLDFFTVLQFLLSVTSSILKFVLVRMSVLRIIISYPCFFLLIFMIMMWSLIIY